MPLAICFIPILTSADAQSASRLLDLAMASWVNRVITMSGCPAGRVGARLAFSRWATVSDSEDLFAWQMQNEVGPYWSAISERLAAGAADLMVRLELHPGVTIFTAAGSKRHPICRPQYRHQYGPQPFLVAGHRSAYRDRAARRPHRLCPWQGTRWIHRDRVRRDGLLHYAAC
jgi:hypothetical protein